MRKRKPIPPSRHEGSVVPQRVPPKFPMRLVYLESPYAGDIEGNIAYARKCMADCIKRGEAPLASHLLYTQPGVLDDGDDYERECGICAGLSWATKAELTVVYIDRGVSPGMERGILEAIHAQRSVVYRRLPA